MLSSVYARIDALKILGNYTANRLSFVQINHIAAKQLENAFILE